jgi:hypothetical protein
VWSGVVSSDYACGQKCMSTTTCLGYNYQMSTGLCEIVNVNTQNTATINTYTGVASSLLYNTVVDPLYRFYQRQF